MTVELELAPKINHLDTHFITRADQVLLHNSLGDLIYTAMTPNKNNRGVSRIGAA